MPAAELDQAFNRKPVLQRIAVVSAGPLGQFHPCRRCFGGCSRPVRAAMRRL